VEGGRQFDNRFAIVEGAATTRHTDVRPALPLRPHSETRER
jgi:hypothetical protein